VNFKLRHYLFLEGLDEKGSHRESCWNMTLNEPHLILGIGELLWDMLPRG